MTPLQHDRLSNSQRDTLIDLRERARDAGHPARALKFQLFDDIEAGPLAKRWVFLRRPAG
jgi:hypothetical protein